VRIRGADHKTGRSARRGGRVCAERPGVPSRSPPFALSSIKQYEMLIAKRLQNDVQRGPGEQRGDASVKDARAVENRDGVERGNRGGRI